MTSASTAPEVPSVDAIPQIPTDEDRELIFHDPWEAKAFALVVHLYQRGHFTWPEWAEQLSEEIADAGATFDGSTYYLCWLSAAERLLSAKSICTQVELAEKREVQESNQGASS